MDANLDRLFQHLEWADGRLLEALGRTPGPPAEAMKLLGHLLGAEQVWLGRIQPQAGDAAAVWPTLTLDQCRALAGACAARFRALVRSAGGTRLAAPIAYVNSRGQAFETPLGDILLHVALHGAHHRGQIAAVLRREGLEPVSTDYIIFVRDRAEQAAASLRAAPVDPRRPGPVAPDPEAGPIGM